MNKTDIIKKPEIPQFTEEDMNILTTYAYHKVQHLYHYLDRDTFKRHTYKDFKFLMERPSYHNDILAVVNHLIDGTVVTTELGRVGDIYNLERGNEKGSS